MFTSKKMYVCEIAACIVFFVFTTICFGQSDTLTGTRDEKIVKFNSDTINKDNQIKPLDSTRYDMFGNLLRDDSLYNKKQPLWRPVVEVPLFNIEQWAFDRFVLNADFSRITTATWSTNIKKGWEWDSDRFGMNFIAHPYSGGVSFLSARSNGYNFWESMPFALGGSIMWEYFGENTRPSYNDVVNTTLSGAFLGEILYRLGSNLLDDRTTGTERFAREFGAAVLSPTRFVNRLMQGKLTRVTTKNVYQDEPLNIELSAGVRMLNTGSSFGSGSQNVNINAQMDYGYPLEKRDWKPFDYFTLRGSLTFGAGRKILENLIGYGILTGKNVQSDKLEMLLGVFQHYNYFDNTTFELGTIAFGCGIMTKYPLAKEKYLFTNFHVSLIPLAGNNTRLGPDTLQVRDYNYGDGMQTSLESGLNLGWGSIQVNGYYYWIHTYKGESGNNFVGIIKPRITIRLVKNLNLGAEQMVYTADRYTTHFGSFHTVRTEQKVYLMLNVGNFKL